MAHQLAVAVGRLGDAVGDQDQELARLQLMAFRGIDELVHRAERRAALGLDLPRRLAGAGDEGRVMPGIDELQLAGGKIEDAGEERDEHHLRVLARDLGIGAGDDDADVGLAAQRAALAQRLAERHEQAGIDALAGDVANRDEQVIGIDRKEIIEVAADLARGGEDGLQVEARVRRQAGRFRQHAHLDAIRGGQLALQLRRRQPLDLELAAQPAALGVGLGQRAAEQRHEHQRVAQRRRRHVDQPQRPGPGGKAEAAEGDQRQDADREEPAQPQRRQQDDQQQAEGGGQRRLGPAGPGRALGEPALEDVLQQLGVDLDPRHRPQRRDLLVDEAEPGHPQQHQPLVEEIGRGLAGQHVRCRDEAPRIMPRQMQPDGTVGLGCDRQRPGGDADDPAALHLESDELRSGGQPQDLQAERGRQAAADRAEQRHAADHAVDVAIGVEQAMPLGRPIEVGQAAQGGAEARQQR